MNGGFATTEADTDLEDVVAQLGDLRRQSHQNRYGEGPPPELPSRDAMTEIVDELIAVMFPRHFGPRTLAGGTLDAFVRTQLAKTLDRLSHQVRLELELTEAEAGGDPIEPAVLIARRLVAGLPRIRALLETDIRAAYEGDPAATSLDEVMCCYPGVAAIIRHRLAHGLHRLGAPMLARVVSEASHAATGIDIHPGAEIGESFFIDHGTGVVIGETAVIGARVRLYQGVTLGARRFEVGPDGSLQKHYPRHPIIGDDVVIYAGATVLGRVTVGRGSVISGSVWLTQSAPPGSVVTQAVASRSVIA
jgi:serine O-acetyltransferase